jgi:hypothetical protein
LITMGIGGIIILPIVKAVWRISEETYIFLFDFSWALGALSALSYSIIALKGILRDSLAGKNIIMFRLLCLSICLSFHYLNENQIISYWTTWGIVDNTSGFFWWIGYYDEIHNSMDNNKYWWIIRRIFNFRRFYKSKTWKFE